MSEERKEREERSAGEDRREAGDRRESGDEGLARQTLDRAERYAPLGEPVPRPGGGHCRIRMKMPPDKAFTIML